MQSIDLTYLQNELAEQSSLQLKQLIQNKGEKIVEEINKLLEDAEDEDTVIFKLSHSISIDLTEMKIKGALAFSVRTKTELTTAIHDPENPELDFGTQTGGNGQGDSGANLGDLEPAGDADEEIANYPEGLDLTKLGKD